MPAILISERNDARTKGHEDKYQVETTNDIIKPAINNIGRAISYEIIMKVKLTAIRFVQTHDFKCSNVSVTVLSHQMAGRLEIPLG